MFWNKKNENKDMGAPMIELGREIERGLVLWWSLTSNHWDEMEGDGYHQGVSMMMDKLLKDETLTNTQRVETAKQLLDISKTYRKQLIKVSATYKEFVTSHLKEFEEKCEPLLKNTPHKTTMEWIKLSKDLCGIREKQMTAIESHINIDEFIPNLFIQDNGAPDHQMTEEEKAAFTDELATYGALRKIAHEEESKMEPARSNIAHNLFGKLDGYMKDGSYSKLLSVMRN